MILPIKWIFHKRVEKLGVRFDGILTGFIASHRQAEKYFVFLTNFKMTTPFFSVIPLWRMTENLRYIRQGYVRRRNASRKRADIISPNLTELCVLTGESYEALSSSESDDIAKAASSLLNDTLSTVIVTGIKKTTPF